MLQGVLKVAGGVLHRVVVVAHLLSPVLQLTPSEARAEDLLNLVLKLAVDLD